MVESNSRSAPILNAAIAPPVRDSLPILPSKFRGQTMSETTTPTQNATQTPQEEKEAARYPATSETQERYWGTVTVLETGQRYRISRLEIKPGHRIMTQIHYHRSEHWIVVSGTAKVICGDDESLVIQNQSTYVPPCTAHRVENPGVIPLVLIEVQNGEFLGDEDTVRLSDDAIGHGDRQPS